MARIVTVPAFRFKVIMKFAALVAFCVLCAQSVPTLNAGSQMTNLFATTRLDGMPDFRWSLRRIEVK